MENENFDYKVGDWVLLKKSFIQKARKMNGDSANGIINIYSCPQKIQAIYQDETKLNRNVLEFSPERKWVLRENVFRIATKKEVKEHNLKSIFLNQ